MLLRSTLLVVLLCSFYSDLKSECTAETIGLCTEGVTTENTTTEIIETTVEHKDSGDLLDGSNGFVTNTKEGDMDSDWGGQGSASMQTGSYCNELGTDKCAEITDSTLTTFYQEVDISSLDINYGGETQYIIEVDKQDAQDSIYMKIIGKNGKTEIFNGTDVLSATGVSSGYQEYLGNFDFAGKITTLSIEIGGKDINLAVGVLFDDVSINVLYNVVSTIVTQQIQDLEEFLILDYGQDANDVAEMIFENNEVNDDFNFDPIDKPIDNFSFESVEIEIQNFEMDFQMEMDTNIEMPTEITVASVEIEMEIDIETPNEQTMDMPKAVEDEPDMETNMDNDQVESKPETVEEDIQEPEMEPEPEQSEEVEESAPEEIKQEAKETEPKPKQDTKPEPKKIDKAKEPTAKQKAATKIVKDMGDKGRYEADNQLKTLIVMQVLGDTKTFFDSQQRLKDVEGFFTNESLPDTILSDNNITQYLLFGGSNSLMDQLVDSQYN